MEDEKIMGAAKNDLRAVKEGDPACMGHVVTFVVTRDLQIAISFSSDGCVSF